MDRRFLKSVAESYISDRSIHNIEYWQPRIYSYLTEIVDNIKETDYQFYEFLDSLPRLHKVNLLYQLISEDLFEEEIGIFESLQTIGAIIHAILNLPKYVLKSLSALDKKADEARKVISTQLRTEKARVLSNILFNNFEKCAKKCGVNVRGLHYTTPLSALGAVASKAGHEQADCLISCYLEYHIDMIKVVATQYKQCLEKTDQRVGKTTNIFSVIPLSSVCNIYYETGMEYINSFKVALTQLYGPDTPKYVLWSKKLNDELSKV